MKAAVAEESHTNDDRSPNRQPRRFASLADITESVADDLGPSGAWCGHRAEKLGDTDVQPRVVTLAKAAPQREWLGEVSRWCWCRRVRTGGPWRGRGIPRSSDG